MDLELLKNIKKAKDVLNVAIKNFESAEGDLIDYYIYEIKANKAKLSYFIKLAKKGYEKKNVI